MGERLRVRLRRPLHDEWPVDVALALAATALNVSGALVPDDSVAYDFRDGGVWVVLLAAVSGLVLLLRRTLPLAVFLVAMGATALTAGLRWPIGWMPFTLLLATYALGARASRRRAVVGLAFAATCLAVLVAVRAPYFESWLAVAAPAQLLVAFGLGRSVRYRGLEAARARARRLAVEHEGAARTERAVLDDRLQVARELHDLVTSSLSVIAVQAAAARRAPTGPHAVLATIEGVSRTALDDLRRLLGALRSTSGEQVDLDPEEAALRASVRRVTGWQDEPLADAVVTKTSWVARDWPVDLALGAGVMALNVTGVLLRDTSAAVQRTPPVVPLVVLLALVPGAALVLRRRFPVAGLLATLLALSLVTAPGWESGTMPGSLLLATYAVGAWAPYLRGAVAMAGMFLVMAVLGVLDVPHFQDWVAPGSVVFGAPWVVGTGVRRRRLIGQRAVDEALAAERARAVATQRAVADERLSVARDLHELVTHSLSAVAVQASVARHLAGEAGTAGALEVIESSSRQALTDLRSMLTALRSDEPSALSPAPGLDELRHLATTHRATHGPVRLEVDAAVDLEPASLRLTAFRLVQEALTNVGKHASGSATVVAVTATPSGVSVTIEDDGAGDAGPSPVTRGGGHGLDGMRERVALFGGTLVTGVVEDGGFRVHAELPRRARAT